GTADITSGRSPSLTKDHCKWAWSFVQWSVGNWLDLMTNVSASDEDRNMRAIKQLLARVADFGPGGKHQDQANYGSGKNNDVLCGKGFMPRSLIGRVTRIKSDEIKKALHALIENEEVEAELVTAGSSRA